ncbi:MAG: hypothetical protein ACRCYE_03655 [Sarcina sp.]
MNSLYKKSETWFAVLFIIIYVVGFSISDNISRSVGIEKSITVLFGVILFAVIFFFIKKNKLFEYYGLCKSSLPAKRFYIIFRLLL